jgi:MFS family permease
MQYRNVVVLALCQALSVSGASMMVLVSGIVGSSIAPDRTLATLPTAVVILGTAVFTIPASLFMRRFGRKRGFMTAAALALTGSLIAAYAIENQSFLLFLVAAAAIGSNLAFVHQYRFAAVESNAPQFASRAIAIVLLGGIVAGILGPEVARISRDWLGSQDYSGSFVILSAGYLLVLLLLTQMAKIEVPALDADQHGVERPLREIIRQPIFIVALLSAVTAYGVMSLIMVATPLHMHVIEGHSLEATSRVIQSHLIAMYVPSLFISLLITRLGATRVMLMGLLAFSITAALTLQPVSVLSYWAGLVLLGIGWNFLFVGGTFLLTRSYHPAERFKTQAFNDFTVFGIQSAASLSAGSLVYLAGWSVLVSLTIPILLGMFLLIFSLRTHFVQQTA